jgi:hypothetical protein
MSIAKQLANTPHERIKITDDGVARQLLLEIGMIHRFKDIPRPDDGPWTVTLGYADHANHWIIATWITGTGDYGFFVLCTPKSQQTSEEALEMLKQVVRSNADGPIKGVEQKIEWTSN